MAPRLTLQMWFLLKSNTRWTHQDEERSRVAGNLNTKKSQQGLLVSTHNQEGGRNKVRVKGGRVERKKREGWGEGSWAELFGGPCSHLSPIMKMGEGPFQYPTPLPWGTLHTYNEPRDTEQAWAASMICPNTCTLAGYTIKFPKIIIIKFVVWCKCNY